MSLIPLTEQVLDNYECKFPLLNLNPLHIHKPNFLQSAAFTESSYVTSSSQSFINSVTRHHQDCFGSNVARNTNKWESSVESNEVTVAIMENEATTNLSRTASYNSTTSMRSQRSQNARARPRRLVSQISSSASSISDKSLTSFPSFSGDSPTQERAFSLPPNDGVANRKSSATTSVADLTSSTASLQRRTALFDDAPMGPSHVPGSIHHANDEHIERLIARNGAVKLVRQIAEDLARRDAQIASLRRKAEERERALRKIILECGLSNLELETRLRTIESGRKASGSSIAPSEPAIADLVNDAMSETVVMGELDNLENDATIRAKEPSPEKQIGGTTKGWKDYIWGGTSKRSSRTNSRASSINGDALVNGTNAPARIGVQGRRTILQDDVFQPPSGEGDSRPPSSESTTGNRQKKQSSLATLALKLVAGTSTVRDHDASASRGRSNSTGTEPPGRTASRTSTKTTMSARQAPRPVPKAIRKPTPLGNNVTARGAPQERWDTMGSSPQGSSTLSNENFGPVEMDTILPPDAQPPTLMQYRNYPNQEFLTDRFGFIYDQRRKKRQREAAEKIRRGKRGSRVEMLSGARSSISSAIVEGDILDEDRPASPSSIVTEDRAEDEEKPTKRWQDYLKIATFPTELLSHTPSSNMPAFEVMEGGEMPKSPGIFAEERGFVPSASTAAAAPAISVTSDEATISKPVSSTPSTPALPQEDTEPVKLLLEQLGEVHDSLQRDKTVRWNEFLRKVRAERRRDGEAAAAALAATTDSRSQRPIAIMPEASLADGEMIGVSGLGNKGKVGRAKWNEFKSLVLGGIPVAYRSKIWAECSGASASRIPGYYDDLVAHRGEEDDPAVVAQIQMDINRTLTDNIFFRRGPGVAKLNEVLLAYSRRNREVGYCQGMNLITAYLLLIMPTAEDAFWVLTSIIEHTLPPGYYDHSLLASRADQQVLRQYVAQILPKLSQHLDDLGIELEALTFQWFLSVFTDCLSAEALFRVWDVVLCMNDGSTFLFQVALALLKLNEQQLLQCSSPAGVYTYINHHMTNHAISIDGLIHASEGLRKVVKRDDIEVRRTRAIEAEKDLVRQREEKNRARRAERAEREAAAAAAAAALSEETKVDDDVIPEEDDSIEEPHESGEGEVGSSDESEELTVRTPMPVEDEMD
ncbi:TBC domain-containing protein [Rutstroemia sp. NJR-2017a WRK4]|nr:TBC domain-containing protein [Rutstroemia sp. NJR-2017a WRK4]